MTCATIALSMLLIAEMVNPLKAQPPLQQTLTNMLNGCYRLALNPILPFQYIYRRELYGIIKVKDYNYRREVTGRDEELFANLTSAGEAIRQEIQNRDKEMMNTVGSDLDKKEAIECKEMYLKWRKTGDELWHSHYVCRIHGKENATMYKETLRKNEHVFVGYQYYQDMLDDCINREDFFLSSGPWTCTLRVIIESLWYIWITADRDFTAYLKATKDLERLREHISSHEKDRLRDFYERAKTIVSDTKDCVNKLGASVHDVQLN